MKVINSNLTIEFTGEEALVLRRMIGEISEENYEYTIYYADLLEKIFNGTY